MRPSSHSSDIVKQASAVFAPKIYYFHPLLAGPRGEWARHLERCRDLGFDTVLMAPPFAPGAEGDIFLTADHEWANPAIDAALSADQLVSEFSLACRKYGLRLFIDIVLGRFAVDAAYVSSTPQWFHPLGAPGSRIDPRSTRRHLNAACVRFDDPAIAKDLIGWWVDRLQRLTQVGVTGFRFEELHLVPPESLRISSARSKLVNRIVVFWRGRPARNGRRLRLWRVSDSTPRSPQLPGGMAAQAG